LTAKFSHHGNDNYYELLKFKDFKDPLPSETSVFGFQGLSEKCI